MDETMRSPLTDLSDELRAVAGRGARIAATEVRTAAQLSLRVHPNDASRSPLALPTRPNTVVHGADTDALWLGPDAWLLVAERLAAARIVATLEDAFAGAHRSIVDVSANLVVIELEGADRLDVLASACPIDLHPRSWDDGRCAQTLFGRAQVLLQEREHTTRLFVRPSFARYVVELLAAAVAAPRAR